MISIEQNVWGMTQAGDAVIQYRATNSRGSVLTLSNIGAGIVGMTVPDRNGVMADVVLGYSDCMSYFGDGACLGKTPGRFANRIHLGRFTLDGKEYRLPVNNGPNHLHGGPDGFQNRLWEGSVEGSHVVFTLDSPDGDSGYPSALRAEVAYELTEDDRVIITLSATSDGPTVLNLTNHAYFNLGGENAGSVLGHELTVYGSHFLSKNADNVPDGNLAEVAGTVMDFTSPKTLGKDIREPDRELVESKGYDHCWAIDGWDEDTVRPAAVLHDPVSGRTLEILTNQPGIQVYTGNYLDGAPMSKSSGTYRDYDGVALECQGFPDAPNHPEFPSAVLRAGEVYQRMIIYSFSAR